MVNVLLVRRRHQRSKQWCVQGLHVLQSLCHDKQADVQEGLVQFFPALLQHLPHTARASFFQTLTQSLSLESATWRCRIGLADQLHTLAALEVRPPILTSHNPCAVLVLKLHVWMRWGTQCVAFVTNCRRGRRGVGALCCALLKPHAEQWSCARSVDLGCCRFSTYNLAAELPGLLTNMQCVPLNNVACMSTYVLLLFALLMGVTMQKSGLSAPTILLLCLMEKINS